MEVGLEEEVERRVEENTQEQVRMSMTMDGTKTHRRDSSHECDSVRMSAMHLKTVRGVL